MWYENKDKKIDVKIQGNNGLVEEIECFCGNVSNVIERRLLNDLNEEKIENYTSHDIESLFYQMVSKIKKKETTTKGLGDFLQPLSSYISDLYAKIKTLDENNKVVVNIDFPRYPTAANGNPHLYAATSGNVVVDVENLKMQYSEVMECLESIYLQYFTERDSFIEYKHEQMQLQMEYESEMRAEYESDDGVA